jgi:broad specificity phosphatase PhoE
LADLWAIRHAAYQGHRPGHHAHPDAPLTSTGRAQALAAAQALPAGITAIVTSHLPRAQQTAEIIARHTNLPISLTSGLFAEWQAPSSLHGLGPDNYPPEYAQWRRQRYDHPEQPFEDGESLTDLHQRVDRAAAVLAEQPPGTTLLVAHAVFLGVLTRLTHSPTEAFREAASGSWPFAEVRPITVHD